jgi:pimeloyl-ACP methyl ester carboxylesterase
MPVYADSERGVDLYYEVQGTGPDRVMLVMGLGMDHHGWVDQVSYFMAQSRAARYSVCTFDNRGIGRSHASGTVFTCSTRQMAVDTVRLATHLGWTRFHLVGVSMGGMVCQEIALLAPERLASLSLLVTHAGGVRGVAPASGLWYMSRPLWQRLSVPEQISNLMQMQYHPASLADAATEARLRAFHEHLAARDYPKPTLSGVLAQLWAIHHHHVRCEFSWCVVSVSVSAVLLLLLCTGSSGL